MLRSCAYEYSNTQDVRQCGRAQSPPLSLRLPLPTTTTSSNKPCVLFNESGISKLFV